MKFLAFSAAMAVIVAGTFLACDSGSKTFNLGGVGPVTGEAATFGASTHNGIDLAVAEWNAKGGVLGKQIKLAFADDKGDPAEAATVYTKLHRAGQGLGHRRHGHVQVLPGRRSHLPERQGAHDQPHLHQSQGHPGG